MWFDSVIIALLVIHAVSASNFQKSLHLRGLEISKCDKTADPVRVENLQIVIDDTNLTLAGILTSELNLSAPLELSVKLQRDFLGIWITVPCSHGVGSCTYEDLCRYGLPTNETCPQVFTESLLPCRCPLPEGTYEIKDPFTFSVQEIEKLSFLASGSYAGSLLARHEGVRISCYNFAFTLYESIHDTPNVVIV